MSNAGLLAILSEIRDIADIKGEIYKEKAYRAALISIKKLTYDVAANWDKFEDDVKRKNIPGVGKGIVSRVKEFVETGRIEDLEKEKKSKEVVAFMSFSKIMGVGPVTIKKWLGMKIYKFSDLRKAISSGKIELNDMQKLGLRYYDDLNQRIPRDETKKLSDAIIRKMLDFDPNIIAVVAGSYRRGMPTQGDIDIIVTAPHYQQDFTAKLLGVLEKDSNFVAAVAKGEEKLTYLYKSPTSGLVRHIDVFYLRQEYYIPYLNYSTGSAEHNQKIREIFKRKGYRLNQNGLYRIIYTFTKTGVKERELKLVPVRTEEELYELAGLEYISPNNRN